VRWVTGHGHGEIPADAKRTYAITGSACCGSRYASVVGIALFISGRRSNGLFPEPVHADYRRSFAVRLGPVLPPSLENSLTTSPKASWAPPLPAVRRGKKKSFDMLSHLGFPRDKEVKGKTRPANEIQTRSSAREIPCDASIMLTDGGALGLVDGCGSGGHGHGNGAAVVRRQSPSPEQQKLLSEQQELHTARQLQDFFLRSTASVSARAILLSHSATAAVRLQLYCLR